jgi:hypothetical protein
MDSLVYVCSIYVKSLDIGLDVKSLFIGLYGGLKDRFENPQTVRIPNNPNIRNVPRNLLYPKYNSFKNYD